MNKVLIAGEVIAIRERGRTRPIIDREFENVIVKQMVKLGDDTDLDISLLTKEQMESILL